MRVETFHDPEYGTIATARDAAGEIVATAVDVVRDGVRVIYDEGAIYEATGELLPWDNAAAADEENTS